MQASCAHESGQPTSCVSIGMVCDVAGSSTSPSRLTAATAPPHCHSHIIGRDDHLLPEYLCSSFVTEQMGCTPQKTKKEAADRDESMVRASWSHLQCRKASLALYYASVLASGGKRVAKRTRSPGVNYTYI